MVKKIELAFGENVALLWGNIQSKSFSQSRTGINHIEKSLWCGRLNKKNYYINRLEKIIQDPHHFVLTQTNNESFNFKIAQNRC